MNDKSYACGTIRLFLRAMEDIKGIPLWPVPMAAPYRHLHEDVPQGLIATALESLTRCKDLRFPGYQVVPITDKPAPGMRTR